MYKTGIGIDYHRLSSGRPLILCGVQIEHSLGLEGHSDADVATHAIIDALLGASNLGDIGEHFPPSDPKYRNMSSLLLLDSVIEKIKKDYEIVNVDTVILAESPKISPHKEKMVATLARHLGIDSSCISIKGKTTEGMGPIGRQEGISAHAVCMLRNIYD